MELFSPIRHMMTVLFGQTLGSAGDISKLPHVRQNNIKRICTIATRRLGDRVSDEGTISARVLAALMADGSYVDDPVAQEYWGGVIASSRSLSARDDRGVRHARLLARLSTYQIRSHYLFYSTLRRLLLDRKIDKPDFDSRRYLMAVFVPAAAYMNAMRFDGPELVMVNALTADALLGLGGENLLDGSNTGTEHYLKSFFQTEAIHGDGIVYAPSLPGIKLMLWAFGAGDRDSGHLAAPNFNCRSEDAPECIEGARLVYDSIQ